MFFLFLVVIKDGHGMKKLTDPLIKLVIQHLPQNDGVINPHQLVRETGFTIGWVKRRLKQCDYRYYHHKKGLFRKN